MILMSIQLFVLSVSSPKSSGASERYCRGSCRASSQMTFTVADTTPTSSSPRRSRRRSIHGSSPCSSRPVPSSITSGQLRTTLHMTSIVCLRTGARECESIDSRSGARSRARDGVRSSETADSVDSRCATVSDEGDDENSGVGGESRSCVGQQRSNSSRPPF